MVDERYDPAFQRGFSPPPEALEGPRPRNPWLIALWILAALLLLTGAFLLTQSAPVVGDSVIPVYVLPAVVLALAPWLVGTGLAAVVGATLVHALRR